MIEAFLLDYPGDCLYGREVTIQLISRIRDQQRLSSVEELKEWIKNDIEAVRASCAG